VSGIDIDIDAIAIGLGICDIRNDNKHHHMINNVHMCTHIHANVLYIYIHINYICTSRSK